MEEGRLHETALFHNLLLPHVPLQKKHAVMREGQDLPRGPNIPTCKFDAVLDIRVMGAGYQLVKRFCLGTSCFHFYWDKLVGGPALPKLVDQAVAAALEQAK